MGNWRSRESTRPQARKRLHPRTVTTWRPVVFTYSASGGLSFGGGASFGSTVVFTYSASGGLSFGGGASFGSTVGSFVGSGGLTFSGVALRSKVFAHTPVTVERVMIAWDAAANAIGYKLYWGTVPGIYPNSVSVGNVLQHVLAGTNFIAGTTYFFSVTSLYLVGAVAGPPTNVRLG